MPIVDVTMVGEPSELVRRNLAGRLADAAGKVFGSKPGHTWVRLHVMARQDYAENGATLPEEIRPVFVSLLKREVPKGRALKAEARALARAIAAACRCKEGSVHLVYEPPGAGRVAFGGQVVE